MQSWSVSNAQPWIQGESLTECRALARPRRARLHFRMAPLGGVGWDVSWSESGSQEISEEAER